MKNSTQLQAFLSKLDVFFAGALNGLFSQILSGDDVIREKAVKFLAVKFKNIPSDLWTVEIENYLMEESKKVKMVDFFVFFRILCVTLHSILFVRCAGAPRLHGRRVRHLHEAAVELESHADDARSQTAHRHRVRPD